MISYVSSLVQKHSPTGILLDTNILLLYFVGAFDTKLVSRFKRTRVFASEDFATLDAFLSNFQTFFTTPNILTEVSNLSSQLPGGICSRYFEQFAKGITVFDEKYIPSRTIAAHSRFPRFGLTDIGILEVLKEIKALVLTDDFKLSKYLQSRGFDVINFNHIRTIN